MNFQELNERLVAAGAQPVYFARYSLRENPPEYAQGDYANGAVSIVDRGEYLVVGASERTEFTEMPGHFRTESEAFDFVLKRATTPLPAPERVDPEENARAKRESPQRAADLLRRLRSGEIS